jgi:hypothetical protein
MKDILLYFVNALFKFAGTTQAEVVKDYLSFSKDSLGLSSSFLLEVINTIWKYFSGAGMGLALIYFLVELNNKMGFENGNVTLKTFFMPFAKLSLAMLLLSASPYIMSQMLAFNDTFVDTMATSFSIDTSTSADDTGTGADDTGTGADDTDTDTGTGTGTTIIEKLVNQATFFQQVGVLLPLLLLWMISLVANFIWMYKALAYKLELVFKISLTPLAIVDCYNTNSTAVIKWVKSVLGLVIYGGILMLLSRVALLNIADATEDMSILDWVANIVTSFVLVFVALGVSGTVKQVCKEALS